MEGGVKQVVVTAESCKTSGTRKRRSSARKGVTPTETRKIEKQDHRQHTHTHTHTGGGGTSPGTVVGLASSRGPITANAPVVVASTAVNAAKSTLAATVTPAPTTGGAIPQKPVKVILGAGKKKVGVVLSPTKVKKLPGVTPQVKTRKAAKKIRMSLSGFGKRVNRANTIRRDAKKQTLEEVKKTLVEAKLIKTDTKAPESVLRQMLSDYMMLKNRAL